MAIEYDRTQPILNDTTVDNIAQASGVIDSLPSLSIDISDDAIIRNLNQRIEDSQSYWDDPKGFDLKNHRNENTRYHLGKTDEQGLYKHQKPYKENQIFVGEESIIAYVTGQIAGPSITPASQEDRSKLFAGNLEKAINCYNEEVADLENIVEICSRNILNKRIAIIKFHFDKNYGKNGEVIAEAIDPEHVILDKNCAKGGNPAFVCHILKRTPDELISEFPDKEAEILKKLGIQRKTPKQMTQELAVREVWLTHYKDREPQEAVVWYFDDLVLDKIRTPNWLYASEDKNLLKFPKKPFIFGNLVNYGTHLVDSTTPVEQAIEQQKVLMRRGRQIMENADKANGILVISTNSGLSKDDGQNYTGDPNQRLFVADENNQGVEGLITQIQAQQLPNYVIQDKLDVRMQVGNLMGAPIDFTGSQADDGDPTLGEVMIKKNAASGRQDMMVRAITRMLRDYYEYLVQMFIVWYDEEHGFTYDSGDGDFDYITLKRDLIEKGIRVKASKPANPDRSRIEAIALKLLDKEAISLLDAYKILQLDNPQQLYDNWAKQKADPNALARDALDVIDESEAYVAFQDIMAGKTVDEKQNPNKEYILSLRKLMINDDFLKAKKSDQNRFIKYVNKCIDSFETRAQLDEASAIEDQNPDALRPQTPLPPIQPPQQSGMPMPGGQQGGMMSQPPPMPPGMPMPGQPPMGMPPGQPMPPPTPSSVFAGQPIPAPGQAPQPNSGNPASLPMV
jgi:hypothetical protein